MAKHRWIRRALGLGLLAGAAYALWRALETDREPGAPEWEPQPFPFPPQPRRPADTPANGADAPGTDARRSDAPDARDGDEAPDARDGDARDTGGKAWLAPTDGACPTTHPVKAKESSRIFHVPGGQSYDRTIPDRCYVHPADAEADGFRAAKR